MYRELPRTAHATNLLCVALLTLGYLVQLLWSSEGGIFILDQRPYVVLGDDAMISMRFARRWAEGQGIYWNSSGSPEGYTNFLLVALMALTHTLGLPAEVASLPIVVLNFSLSLLAVRLLYMLGRQLASPRVARWSAVLLAGSWEFVFWGAHGFETALLVVLALAALLANLRGRHVLLALATSLGVLARDDFLLLLGAIAATHLLGSSGARWLITRHCAALLAVPVLTWAAHSVWRLGYYGDFWPNTFYLKATGWALSNRIRAGLLYVLPMAPLLLVAASGCWRMTRRADGPAALRTWASGGAATAAYTFYGLWLGGDSFPGARLLAPVWAFIILAGCAWIHSQQGAARRIPPGSLVVVPLLITFPVGPGTIDRQQKNATYFSIGTRSWGVRTYTAGPFLRSQAPPFVSNVLTCLLLRREAEAHLAREKSIGLYYAGTPAYFCNEFRAVDLLGKCDTQIARLSAGPGRAGHNKYDYDYSLGVERPEYLLSMVPSLYALSDPAYANAPVSDFNWHILLRSKVFQEVYAGTPVSTIPPIVFRRSDPHPAGGRGARVQVE